jgi:putative tryptophan/tyrosine transport system substrate-binding protein
MRKKFIPLALCAMFLALCKPTVGQQTKKIARIGFLTAISASSISARMEAFRRGLHDLGYVEGKNIVIDYRYSDGTTDSLSASAAELVRAKVDVIVTAGASATDRAKQATSTIPIVMAQDSDPVATGAVASLARPGGNISGLSTFAPAIAGKRLELLKEVVPKLSHVAVFGSTNPVNALALKEIESVAKALALKVQTLDILGPKDIETAFRAAGKEHAGAVLVLVSAVSLSQRPQILKLAVKSRLPVIYPQNEYVEDGGLMSYAPNYADLFRRAATYVDKILKGAKPADLPVEQPTKFEFIVNLKAAKLIGLTIPPNVLARVDRVIK